MVTIGGVFCWVYLGFRWGFCEFAGPGFVWPVGISHTMIVVSRLSWSHSVKVGTMEEVALDVGEVIGHGSVKSATWMNGAVVLFLEKVAQVNRLLENGINVGGLFESVLQLTQPATKITLSNVSPFISDEFLSRELSRHGKEV